MCSANSVIWESHRTQSFTAPFNDLVKGSLYVGDRFGDLYHACLLEETYPKGTIHEYLR